MAGYAKGIDVANESDEKIERVLQKNDAQNTKKSTKFSIQPSKQTAEESAENLDKRLASFFANCLYYVFHKHFSFSV